MRTRRRSTGEEAKRLRRANALLNHVAQDRPNFASEASSKVMSDPTVGALGRSQTSREVLTLIPSV